ncbi:hypothetical protein F4778DRAFT_783762 [Xylariomycetidae sp. FL2044]|nr:hypothetical protein F4778DRAFT_783762 [Xylariomycetidae sp. FL2044]
MNQIRAIQALNKREIENGVSPNASWHTDYRDTAFVNFGGLPYELSEGDIITIFSQYGEPVFLKLARDKESGKSKGFGWLKYEDQRSTDLAVDNLGGAEIGGRLVRVDHARYKARDDEDPDEFLVGWDAIARREKKAAQGQDAGSSEEEEEEEEVRRPMIKEERELAKLIQEHDEDDPMKAFLIEEKKKEVGEALKKVERRERKDKERERRHKDRNRDHHRHHHRSHRSRRDERSEDDGRDDDPKKRSKRDETSVAKDRSATDGDRDGGSPDSRKYRGDSRDRERRRRDDDHDHDRDYDDRHKHGGDGRRRDQKERSQEQAGESK